MNTTPPPMPEALRLADWLQSRAESIEQVNAAHLLRAQHERITALESDHKMLREALTPFAEFDLRKQGVQQRLVSQVLAARAALENTK